jgi:PAS domain S-box-containing protein
MKIMVQTMNKSDKNDIKRQTWPSNTNFEELFYQSPIGIFLYDKEGKLTNANDAALNIARIPKLDDVLGTNLFDNPKIASKREEILKKKLIKFQDTLNLFEIKEQNIYNPSEMIIIDIDWIVSIIDSGYLVQIQDITEKKKTEEELKENQDFLHAVIEGISDPIFVKDHKSRILLANLATLRVVGKPLEQVVGKDDMDLYEDPEVGEAIMANDRRIMETGRTEVVEEVGQTPHGYRTFLSTKTPYYNSNGGVIGIIGVTHDITELKNAENERQKMLEKEQKLTGKLQSYNEQLSQSKDELNDTINKLKVSNSELERFAYVSSHDLQEPLRMVTLYSQLLERRYKDRLDSEADDFIEYIVENARRMKHLIDDLLEYSRVTSQSKEFENVNLEKIVDIVLTNLSVSIAENNIKVICESLPTVYADKNQMLQLFQNLLTNAIKFRGDKPPEINIYAQKWDKGWKFAIKDNGIGIESNHQEQIFEVFKRLHTKEEYSGTGIGLSIVQKIIKHHRGRIWVDSEPGNGSTFYFTLPK